jgi:iron complex outermembrane receptor protein
MKGNYLFALSLFSCITVTSYAQEIKGKITEAGTARSIPGVTIAAASKGTVTNDKGEYSLKLNPGDNTVIVSSVGYTSQTFRISVAAGETKTLDAVLAFASSDLSELVVTGSRSTGRTKLGSPVPVDIIDIKSLAASSPQINLTQILNYVAPSFSSNTTTVADGTDHVDPASLRGLGVDQVLVLVNGKRYHKTSLLNQNGTVGRGQVGTDLNSIPVSSIDRIEILRDGAAAQYGSDAISGVINIILKKQTGIVEASVFTGAYATAADKKAPGTGLDGKQLQIALNYGIPLTKDGGFINFSGALDDRTKTNRQVSYLGTIYQDYNNPALYPNPTGVDITEEELKRRGETRSDFNMNIGQSAITNANFTFNSVFPFNDHQFEFYAFGGAGFRKGRASGYYRLPYNSRNVPEIYPSGFLPYINSRIFDINLAAGIRGKLNNGWNVDFSNIYGGNKFLYIIDNTLNASLLTASPTRFDAGGHAFYQNTTNFDISKRFEEIGNGLNIALGAENRYENYQIIAGEEGSWRNYGLKKRYITSSGDTILIDDPNGEVPSVFDPISGGSRPGGSQVFPGFKKSVNQFRNSYAGYLDAEWDITSKLLIGAAIRAENYSDFGSTFNWKAVARYNLTDNFVIRGSYNTGFRAPDLHQIYYQNTNTLFSNGVLKDIGTFPNDSRAAKLLGIPKLTAEQSKGFTGGLTAKAGKFSLSADYYNIYVKNRIVVTGTFTGDPAGTPAEQEVYAILQQANAGSATFYVNAINTRTQGLDFVLTYRDRIGNGTFNTDIAGTFSSTKREGDVHTPKGLETLASTFFNEESRIILEQAAVREKISWTLNYKLQNWNFFVRNVHFGPVYEIYGGQEYSPKIITDLAVSYTITKGIQLTVGSNNLLDIYPDKVKDKALQDDGRYIYSPTVYQFGINGRFVFAKLNFTL